MIKDAHELELLRLACCAALTCYATVLAALQPGTTETTATAPLCRELRTRLGPGQRQRAVGQYTALPARSEEPANDSRKPIVAIDDGVWSRPPVRPHAHVRCSARRPTEMKRVFDIVSSAAARLTVRLRSDAGIGRTPPHAQGHCRRAGSDLASRSSRIASVVASAWHALVALSHRTQHVWMGVAGAASQAWCSAT